MFVASCGVAGLRCNVCTGLRTCLRLDADLLPVGEGVSFIVVSYRTGKSSFYQPVPEHILETPVGFLGKYLFSTRERSGQPLGCEGKGCTEKPLSSAGGGRRRFGGEGEEPGEEVTAPADAPFGGPCAVEQSLARPP